MTSQHDPTKYKEFYEKNKEQQQARKRAYYQANKTRLAEEKRKWRLEHKEEYREYERLRRVRNGDKMRKRERLSYIVNREKRKKSVRVIYHRNHNLRQNQRIEMMEILGGSKCAKCGFDDIRALQLDHINGDGYKRSSTDNLSYYMKKYIDDPELTRKTFQVLCANCNWIKRVENKEYLRRK